MSLVKGVKEQFETNKCKRALLLEWKALRLKDVFTTNRDETPSAFLEMLIAKLTDIQTSLIKEYRNDTILRSKLLNAVSNVDDCRLVD